MIRKQPQINHVEETENVKWCVFKVPQYIFKSIVIDVQRPMINGFWVFLFQKLDVKMRRVSQLGREHLCLSKLYSKRTPFSRIHRGIVNTVNLQSFLPIYLYLINSKRSQKCH